MESWSLAILHHPKGETSAAQGFSQASDVMSRQLVAPAANCFIVNRTSLPRINSFGSQAGKRVNRCNAIARYHHCLTVAFQVWLARASSLLSERIVRLRARAPATAEVLGGMNNIQRSPSFFTCLAACGLLADTPTRPYADTLPPLKQAERQPSGGDSWDCWLGRNARSC